MSEEREREERALGELPDDLEGAGERDEISGWGARAVPATAAPDDVPHADLVGGQADRVPSIRESLVGPPVEVPPAPVYTLLPSGAHPWSMSSDDVPRRPFSQWVPWEFDIRNTSGYEMVLEEIDWSLLPLNATLQHLDVRMTGMIKGAPALGLSDLPVGQGAVIKTQLRLPTESLLSLRVRALERPTEQTPVTPISYPMVVRDGEKIWSIGGEDASGNVSRVSFTGDWGKTWKQLPDFPSANLGYLAPAIAYKGALFVMVPGLTPQGNAAGELYASDDGGISWQIVIADVADIDPLITNFGSQPTMAIVDGWWCHVVGNGAGAYITFRTQYGRSVASWEKVVGNTLPVPFSNSDGSVWEFGDRLVVLYGVTSAGNLQLAWSGDRGTTWAVVDTPVTNVQGVNVFVHGGQLWIVNGGATGTLLPGGWWTDDLLNWHPVAKMPWSMRFSAGMAASERRVLCWGGTDNAGTWYGDVWSGGMLYSTTDSVLHPSMKVRGFYLPPRK